VPAARKRIIDSPDEVSFYMFVLRHKPAVEEQFLGMASLIHHHLPYSKGCWRDNVFVEWLWRTVKYEEVYLRAYDSVSQAQGSLARYLDFYNTGRPHSRLDRMTPDSVYFNELPQSIAA